MEAPCYLLYNYVLLLHGRKLVDKIKSRAKVCDKCKPFFWQTECADSPDPHPNGPRPVFLGLGSLADARALPAEEAQRIGAGSPKGAPSVAE